MRVVIDSNKIFAALRAQNTRFRETLFSEKYTFYAPKYILVEIFKHKERILKGAKTSDESDIYEYLNTILQRICFVNEDFVSISNYAKAYQLCKVVDEFDTPFIALALELDAPLWTNDEKLKAALRSQGFDAFM